MTKRSTKKPNTGSSKVAAPLRQLPALALGLARDVGPLVERVVAILEEARSRVVRTVNSTMVLAYWHVGREIVEFVQRGAKRAEYGEQVLEELSTHLQARMGRGYSVSNLRYFRIFYLRYSDRRPQIHHEARDESAGRGAHPRKRHEARDELAAPVRQGFSSRLSWTHYRTLTKVDDPAARAFYEIEADREGWSVPHLERQIHTQLFARLLKSRDKAGVMDLARRGQAVERPIDLMKSPVVLDFLDLPESELLRERDLERAPRQAVPVPPRAGQGLRVRRPAKAADVRGRGVLCRPRLLQHHSEVLPADRPQARQAHAPGRRPNGQLRPALRRARAHRGGRPDHRSHSLRRERTRPSPGTRS
jgi:hypothetical protein